MWSVQFDDNFAEEFAALDDDVQDAIRAYALALEQEGPSLSRPRAATLSGSDFANMKELRPTVNKVEWRVVFAFDPKQEAILLCAAAKGGKKESLIYKRLIATADHRFRVHLARLKKESGTKTAKAETINEKKTDRKRTKERSHARAAQQDDGRYLRRTPRQDR